MTGNTVAARWDALKGTSKKRQVKEEEENLNESQVNENTNANEEDAAPEDNFSAEDEDSATHVNPEDESGIEDTQTNDDEGNTNWKKRYNDSRKFIQGLQDEIKTLKDTTVSRKELEELKTQLTQAKTNTLPTSKEEVAKLKTTNPELYKAIALVIGDEVSESLDQIKKGQAELEFEKAMTEVKKVHPDAAAIQTSKEFLKWYQAQSPKVKALFEEGSSVADWVLGIDSYKKSINQVDDKKQLQKESIKTTSKKSDVKVQPTSDKKIWLESNIEKMSPKEFAKYEKEIDKALAEGRVVLDVSKR